MKLYNDEKSRKTINHIIFVSINSSYTESEKYNDIYNKYIFIKQLNLEMYIYLKFYQKYTNKLVFGHKTLSNYGKLYNANIKTDNV